MMGYLSPFQEGAHDGVIFFFIEVTAKWMVSTMNSPAILVNVKGGLAQTHCNDPLVVTNIAMENGPCIADQDDLPINYCDFPWLC